MKSKIILSFALIALVCTSCVKNYDSLTELEKKRRSKEKYSDYKDNSEAYYHFTLSQLYFYKKKFYRVFYIVYFIFIG